MDRNSAARSIQELIELRSHDGTESEIDVGEARVDGAARRATAAFGGVVPRAAAQQTSRARHGPGGVNHAGSWIVGIEVLAPLPHVAKHVI